MALSVLRRRAGFGTLQVSFVGKAATACLLYAFPLLFLGDHPGWGGTLARVIGWAFATWGTVVVLVGRDAVPRPGKKPGR